MSDPTANTIAFETAIERLRQERETFEQRRTQESRWFSLRLRMGYTALVLLPTIAGVSSFIIYNEAIYSELAVNAAIGAMFVDLLGLITAIYKVVLNPDSMTKLDPVTSVTELPKLTD